MQQRNVITLTHSVEKTFNILGSWYFILIQKYYKRHFLIFFLFNKCWEDVHKLNNIIMYS